MTPEQKFARYVELCEIADEALDRAIEQKTDSAWRNAEARNTDACDYWRYDVERTATAQAMAYRAARLSESLAWIKSFK
jgi:hypothetical protein